MTEGQSQHEESSAKAAASPIKANHENRRRLLKAAALAAPLMITLRGKPAHAQLSSLGSAGILYGPGAYVTNQDVLDNPNVLSKEDIGKAVKIEGGKKKVLDDKTRRDQVGVESITTDGKDNPNGNPLKGQVKQFDAD